MHWMLPLLFKERAVVTCRELAERGEMYFPNSVKYFHRTPCNPHSELRENVCLSSNLHKAFPKCTYSRLRHIEFPNSTA